MIDAAKVGLDLALSPSPWPIPSDLLLDTQSTVGYGKRMKRAIAQMKPGVNKSVNLEITSVGVKQMDGRSSNINRPTSHPSNKDET